MDLADIAFWERVDIRGEGTCWPWLGAKMVNGYGTYRGGKNKVLAHRFAWQSHNGRAVHDGLFCCHTCDNRICCNPDHMFLGTAKENTQDMLRKGRDGMSKRFGENHERSVLTDAIVTACRARCRAGETIKSLSVEFCVDQKTINSAVNGKTWMHLPDAFRPGNRSRYTSFTESQVLKMRELHRSGRNVKSIAVEFGACYSGAWSAITGKTWTHLPM